MGFHRDFLGEVGGFDGLHAFGAVVGVAHLLHGLGEGDGLFRGLAGCDSVSAWDIVE